MKLFISYAHDDIDQVTELAEELRSRGHEPWFGEKLMPGDDWRSDLRRAIADSDALVYALSPHSAVKEWCRWECAQAIESNKPIFPVLLRDTPGIPDTLGDYTVPNFEHGATESFVTDLNRILGHMTAFTLPVTDMDGPENPRGIPAQAMETTVPPGMRGETIDDSDS
jgi:hypothetical protein